MSDADIRWENLHTLYKYRNADSGFGYELRVGRWHVNGRANEVVLVKQEFKEGDSGFVKWGKARGLTSGDLYRVFSMAKPLSDLMQFPLPKEFAHAFTGRDEKERSELFETNDGGGH